jgi:RNA polymerase sigma-70 factor (ECF subfamily)
MSDTAFARETEPFRKELLAHCYRMLGSVHDAEDLVQETYLRAWRAYDQFEGRSSIRSWLYRIATNTCLTALERKTKRELPSGLGAPADDPDTPGDMALEVNWLQPIPDTSLDPAAIVAGHESLRLALIASLQYLPARQRAVLLLRDVLAFPAADVAKMLDTTTAAVKSMLQRARARLDERPADLREPTEPAARALLDQYMAAFEQSDPKALEQLLRADATLEVTPSKTWFNGRRTCLPYLVNHVMAEPGFWRMKAMSANGQPAAATWFRGQDGEYVPFGIIVLTVTTTGIARIVGFNDPGLIG